MTKSLFEQVRLHLKTIPKSHFFRSYKNKNALMGSMKGAFTYFLVLEQDRKLSYDEIRFSEKIRRCNGDFLVLRSLHDLCELAKIRGWVDDES